MNPEAQAVLDAIQAKDPSELTVHDKLFLRARADYLGRRAKQKYADILNAKPEDLQAEVPQASTEETTPDNTFPPQDTDEDDDTEE